MQKVLLIHGIGGHDATVNSWKPDWISAISMGSGIPIAELNVQPLLFDHLFQKREAETGTIKYWKALKDLLASWIGAPDQPESKSLADRKIDFRWHAGMVAQFTTDPILRSQLSKLLTQQLNTQKPDLVFAHSLGSLIIYDLLKQDTGNKVYNQFVLVSFGSQIGHKALRQLFGGKIEALNLPLWINLHNPYDPVFAWSSIKILPATNFLEVNTTSEGGLSSSNHDALGYLKHENTIGIAWPAIKARKNNRLNQLNSKNFKLISKGIKNKLLSKPKQKALLIGINEYPDPSNRLSGCVNDVYRMSEVLQEIGIQPQNIKVVLDDRASRKNIIKMMDWLLGDAIDGDNCFFFYSGHGAQIPSVDMEEESDHLDECLVCHDFDWTREHAYTDKEFVDAYSQLSFGVNFTVMLDCCHSGGMSRDGVFKARGINAPDDVRHRMIKWDPKRNMWIPRKMPISEQKLFEGSKAKHALFLGEEGNTQRFGRGISLWSGAQEFKKIRKKYNTKGAYMPMILEACAENEFAYEYRHGVTSYGAFTYALTTMFRQYNVAKQNNKNKELLTYTNLIAKLRIELNKIGYKQQPQIIGPSVKTDKQIPGFKF